MKTTASLLFLLASFAAHSETIYRATTVIGNKTFQDILIIESLDPLKGSLTVPGVFTSPILQGGNLDGNLVFGIIAHENGEDIKVTYNLKGVLGETLKGVAHLENGQFLGTVNAQRIFAE